MRISFYRFLFYSLLYLHGKKDGTDWMPDLAAQEQSYKSITQEGHFHPDDKEMVVVSPHQSKVISLEAKKLLFKLELLRESEDSATYRASPDLPLRMKVAFKKQQARVSLKKTSVNSISELELGPRHLRTVPSRPLLVAKQPLQGTRRSAERDERDEVQGVKQAATLLTTKVSVFRRVDDEVDLAGVNLVRFSHPAAADCCLAQSRVRTRRIPCLGR